MDIYVNISWQVIADYGYKMTVAFYMNDKLFTIVAGDSEDITKRLINMKGVG